MESTFPECRGLFEAYNRCFRKQSWSWGRAAGDVEDDCEETFDRLKECINAAVKARRKCDTEKNDERR